MNLLKGVKSSEMYLLKREGGKSTRFLDYKSLSLHCILRKLASNLNLILLSKAVRLEVRIRIIHSLTLINPFKQIGKKLFREYKQLVFLHKQYSLTRLFKTFN